MYFRKLVHDIFAPFQTVISHLTLTISPLPKAPSCYTTIFCNHWKASTTMLPFNFLASELEFTKLVQTLKEWPKKQTTSLNIEKNISVPEKVLLFYSFRLLLLLVCSAVIKRAPFISEGGKNNLPVNLFFFHETINPFFFNLNTACM